MAWYSQDWRAEVLSAPDVALTNAASSEVVTTAPEQLRARAETKLRELAAKGQFTGDPNITLDEYTAARIIASEHASGSPDEQACIADEAVNRATAKGTSVYRFATRYGLYGKQGKSSQGTRPVSTRRNPKVKHLLAARAVLSGEAKGISNGAIVYFDPLCQYRMHKKDPRRHSCSATTLVKAWTYDLGRQGTARCPSNDRKGPNQKEWVGPIPGVDPTRLMLLRPATSEQDKRFAQSYAICEAVEKGLEIPIFDKSVSPQAGILVALLGLGVLVLT